MLEVLFDVNTLEVRGWNRDPESFGHFTPKANEDVVVLEGDPPGYDSDQFYLNLEGGIISGEPVPEEEPLKFEPPAGTGIVHRVDYIEEFLREAFKGDR